MAALDPARPKRRKDVWEEVSGRAIMSKTMIDDTTGMLDVLYPNDRGLGPDFGDEIKDLTNKLVDSLS